MYPSEEFYRKTQRAFLYNITVINNIPSIIKWGIISHERAQHFQHESIALAEVQERRALIKVPNGKKLHSYANLYFDFHNPMMYKRQNQAEDMCVLAISSKVLDLSDCIVSDRNAASDYARFYEPADAMENLDFEKIYAKNWNHIDQIEKISHKSIKCAEILIPNKVPYSYIIFGYVMNQEAKERMLRLGFDKEIKVEPIVFFR